MAKGVGGNRGAGLSRGDVLTTSTDSVALKAARDDIGETFPDGPRMEEAVSAMFPGKYDESTYIRENGKITGAIAYWRAPDAVKEEALPAGNYIRVRHLGSLGGGAGAKLLKMVEKKAFGQGAGVYLSALQGAYSFYERMGYTRGLGATFYKLPPGR